MWSRISHPNSLFLVTLLLLCFVQSAFTTPLERRKPLPLQVMAQGADKNGCTDFQIAFLQVSLNEASQWTKSAARFFAKTDPKLFAKYKGSRVWLSADDSIASGQAFPNNNNQVPPDFSIKNNQKRDAKMHLENVAQSYAHPLQKVEISIVDAMKPRKDRGGSFIFICFPEPTEASAQYCSSETALASTKNDHDRMILCPKFFGKTYTAQAEPPESEAEKAVQTLVDQDEQAYKMFIEDQTHAHSYDNPVSTLIHEGQHAQAILQSTKKYELLWDIPDHHTLSLALCLKSNYRFKENRSRNAEDWAWVSFTWKFDRQRFLSKGKKWIDAVED